MAATVPVLSTQFADLAGALNVGVLPQGDGTWTVPLQTDFTAVQGELCGGPSLFSFHMGLLTRSPLKPHSYYLDSIALAHQRKIEEGYKMAYAMSYDKRERHRERVEGELIRRSSGHIDDVIFRDLEYAGAMMVMKDDPRAYLPVAFRCIDHAMKALAFSARSERCPAYPFLQELLVEVAPFSPELEISHDGVITDVTRETVAKLNPEAVLDAKREAGMAWSSFVQFLTTIVPTEDVSIELFEAVVYRSAYWLYAAKDFDSLSKLCREVHSYLVYHRPEEKSRIARYALRYLWAESFPSNETDMDKIRKVYGCDVKEHFRDIMPSAPGCSTVFDKAFVAAKAIDEILDPASAG